MRTFDVIFGFFLTKQIVDPYCKVWLQFGDKRVEKRKTPIYKCNLNPVFNSSFSYNVPWEKIRECSLDIMVMDFDNIGRNELIGRIVLAGNILYFYSTHHVITQNNSCQVKMDLVLQKLNIGKI